MIRRSLLLLLLPAFAFASSRHFEVSGSFVPASKAGANGSVAVTFRALDPDVKVNETPAPRLRLDVAQSVLVDKQAPAPAQVPDYDPLTARYVDTQKPVLFPVAVAPAAAKGEHSVRASVVFFYCSTREAWCRRGTADLEIPVAVR
jgi:hypothetical protein